MIRVEVEMLDRIWIVEIEGGKVSVADNEIVEGIIRAICNGCADTDEGIASCILGILGGKVLE